MNQLRSPSIWLLPFVAALVAGCVAPGDPGHVDPPETSHVDPPETEQPSRPPPPPDKTPTILEPASADVLFLVDRSASWKGRMDRWLGLSDAVKAFAVENEGAHQLAAAVFPRFDSAGETCDPADYRGLDRAWSPSSSPVEGLLDTLTFDGGSTLGPALRGAIGEARAHAAANRDRSTSIVLLTDATPNDDETCDESAWESVAGIAGNGFVDGRGPVAHVHVVSVVGTAVSPDHFARIGAIAEAGNGYAAIVNGSRDDVARSSTQALDDIRARMTTCTLVVPPGVHPEALTIESPDGSIAAATRVDDASACSGAAFYLDDPKAPHLATLCSGPGGVGGFCEMTYVRAQLVGAPKVVVSAERE